MNDPSSSSSFSSSTLPKTQHAWTYTSQGLPRDILSLSTTFPVPPPPSGSNLLIRVTHVGLNPGCYMTLQAIPPFIRKIVSQGKTTWIPEGEFSGIVVLVGPGVARAESRIQTDAAGRQKLDSGSSNERIFTPGTCVFGSLPVSALLGGDGALAQYISVSSSQVAVAPSSMKMEEAAGLSGAGCTAWAMLNEVPGLSLDITKDTRVFVNGGSGGVGTMLIQLAKNMGAHVVATCSERSRALIESLGADEVIDYQSTSPLPTHLTSHYSSQNRKFDYIFDTIGSQTLFLSSPSYLVPHGAYINVGNFEGIGNTVLRAVWNTYARWYLPTFLGGVPRRYIMVSTTPNGIKAGMLARMVEDGKLRVVIDEVVEFEDVLRAYDRMLARNALGKIIIKVQDV
ncbi:zinc ion binding [Stygiomarasmius scandens]|uniref:Zinc ion binding n=1 Tax=Marasmiellus scandens TaxID=2682957 RepID=A0ABR1JCB2_9AGAR